MSGTARDNNSAVFIFEGGQSLEMFQFEVKDYCCIETTLKLHVFQLIVQVAEVDIKVQRLI